MTFKSELADEPLITPETTNSPPLKFRTAPFLTIPPLNVSTPPPVLLIVPLPVEATVMALLNVPVPPVYCRVAAVPALARLRALFSPRAWAAVLVALMELTLSVPALIDVRPLKVFKPERTQVPDPLFKREV